MDVWPEYGLTESAYHKQHITSYRGSRVTEEQNKHELMSGSPSGLRKIEKSQYGVSLHLTFVDLQVLHQHFPESFTLELEEGNFNASKVSMPKFI